MSRSCFEVEVRVTATENECKRPARGRLCSRPNRIWLVPQNLFVCGTIRRDDCAVPDRPRCAVMNLEPLVPYLPVIAAGLTLIASVLGIAYKVYVGRLKDRIRDLEARI